MYGKLFDQMYDGTLRESWEALVTFQQMIVLCDADGVVDMTTNAIASRTGIPSEIVAKGVETLEQCDPYSRTPDEEGRRIIRLDDHRPWGWSIVNHKKYKALQDADHVREQNRLRKQRQRNKENGSSQPVTNGHSPSLHTDTDTDKHLRNFATFWISYPKKKDKSKAKKSFLKIKPNDKLLSTILSDIKTRPDWKDVQFVPLPATYLNNARWEDEHDSKKPQSGMVL